MALTLLLKVSFVLFPLSLNCTTSDPELRGEIILSVLTYEPSVSLQS